jgi:arginine decarboxylase
MFAALSVHTDNESLIVCNGYKDDAFIRTALLGRKLGKKVILIAEKLSEVRAICRLAKDLNVEPMIGLRVRLVTRGAGKWAESGGESAKFGLSTMPRSSRPPRSSRKPGCRARSSSSTSTSARRCPTS